MLFQLDSFMCYFFSEKGKIPQVGSASEFDKADREMIKFGLYHAALALKDSKQLASAKEIMNLGAQWFEDEKDWQRYYDEIVN